VSLLPDYQAWVSCIKSKWVELYALTNRNDAEYECPQTKHMHMYIELQLQ